MRAAAEGRGDSPKRTLVPRSEFRVSSSLAVQAIPDRQGVPNKACSNLVAERSCMSGSTWL